MSRDRRVVVIGAGSTGLVCAINLARAGLEVTVCEHSTRPGGACSSVEATLPGFVHDHCAGFNPMTVASPAMRELSLEARGFAGSTRTRSWRIRSRMARPSRCTVTSGRRCLPWKPCIRAPVPRLGRAHGAVPPARPGARGGDPGPTATAQATACAGRVAASGWPVAGSADDGIDRGFRSGCVR